MDAFAWTLDPIGNRIRVTKNEEPGNYSANALNQCAKIADGVTKCPTYDVDGNMLSYNDWGFWWNGENRLFRATNTTHVISLTRSGSGSGVGQANMNETKHAIPFEWGVFFVNTSPFLLAVVIALGMFRSNPAAVIIALACPVLMLVTLIPIALCLRSGLAPRQRVITLVLDVIAFGFYAVVSWGVFMLWRIGPLKH